MTDFASSLTRTIARQYDLFQASLARTPAEGAQVPELRVHGIGQGDLRGASGAALPRGVPGGRDWSRGRRHRRRLRQRRAGLPPVEHVRVQPPGWLQHLRTAGSLRQRAGHTGNVAHKLSFRLGEAERLTGVADSSVDRILAIECAFYFDRPRFYRRAAQVLKPDGLVVLADIAFADRAAFLAAKGRGPATGRHAIVKPYRMGEAFPHTIRVPHQ